MKWNILIGSLILGLGICTQGFGFELLDRMVGTCGCESSCCETKCCKQKCCKSRCDGGCERTCCDPAPTCGCEKKCCGHNRGCCEKKCCGHNRGCCEKKCCGNGNGCCDRAPKCGCEKKCCKSKCHQGCLLDRIFACNKCCHSHNRCGCESACGCGGEIEMNGGDDMGPMPPAPVVDPSAFLPSPRTVVSANLVR